jgi:RNA polymerase sigma factor (sigma-70 family)
MDDNKFEAYFKRQIEKFALTDKEEKDCAIAIYENKESKQECADSLAKATLKTVLSVAKKYMNKGMPLEEMVSEGYFGILDALKTYNPYYDPKARFATHAFFCIKNRILKALNSGERAGIRDEISLDKILEVPDFEEKFGIINYSTPEEEAIEKSNEEFLISRLKEILTVAEFDLVLSLVGFKYPSCKQQTPRELAYDHEVTDQRVYQQIWEIRKKLIDSDLMDRKGRIVWR